MSRSFVGQAVLLPTSVEVAKNMNMNQGGLYRDKSFGEYAGDYLDMQVIHQGFILGREDKVTDYEPPKKPDSAVLEAAAEISSSLSPEQIGNLLIVLSSI